MDLLSKIAFSKDTPFIARSAGRSLVGSINFAISNLLQQHLRQQRFAETGVEEGMQPTIDEHAEVEGAKAGDAESERNREEQGHTPRIQPLDLAAKLKLIRNAVNADLYKNAARVPMATNPGQTLPDARHVGAAFGESVAYQAKMPFRPNRAQAEAEAKVLGRTVEEIEAAQLSNHVQQQRYLAEMVPDILSLYDALEVIGEDGHALDLDDANAVFTKLPAVTRERLVAKVDAALYQATQREVQRHLKRRPDALGNIGLIEGLRREIRAAWTVEAGRSQVAKELKEAEDNGATRPSWAPAPQAAEQKKAA